MEEPTTSDTFSSIKQEKTTAPEEDSTQPPSNQPSSTISSSDNNHSTPSQLDMDVTPPPKESTTTSPGKEEATPKEENPPDSNDALKIKPDKPKGKKKKKLPIDPTAPRQPLSGYMRYLNERRETVRTENPTLSFADITKVLAEEWNHLPQEKKQPYVEAGHQDRERYTRELNAYKQTDAYRASLQAQSEKKARKSRDNAVENGVLSDCQEVIEEADREGGLGGSLVSIFTNEFLDFNRGCEAACRQLRNQNTEFEEQNARLEKLNENLQTAIEGLEKKNLLLRFSNVALQSHLDNMRVTMAKGFRHLVVPEINSAPTLATMDEYVTDLEKLISKKSAKQDQLIAQVQEIFEKSDFEM